MRGAFQSFSRPPDQSRRVSLPPPPKNRASTCQLSTAKLSRPPNSEWRNWNPVVKVKRARPRNPVVLEKKKPPNQPRQLVERRMIQQRKEDSRFETREFSRRVGEADSRGEESDGGRETSDGRGEASNGRGTQNLPGSNRRYVASHLCHLQKIIH